MDSHSSIPAKGEDEFKSFAPAWVNDSGKKVMQLFYFSQS
jgi:hypothetical protein